MPSRKRVLGKPEVGMLVTGVTAIHGPNEWPSSVERVT
jgi:hypothetical protein